LASCNKKNLFNQPLSEAVKPKPAAGTKEEDVVRTEPPHYNEERSIHIKCMITPEQIHQTFCAALAPEEVWQYLRVLNPVLNNIYLACCNYMCSGQC
jgi:hypothetical protein